MSDTFNKINKEIEQLINDNKTCINIKEFDLSELNSNEYNIVVKKIYSYNLEFTKKIKSKIEKLKEYMDDENEMTDDIVLTIPKKEDNVSSISKNNKFYNYDINNYIYLVDNFKESIDFEILNELIPDDKFVEIINRLLAHYLLEKITIKKLGKDEEIEIFYDDILKLENIIDNLNILKSEFESDDITKRNDLIYKVTPNGNISFFNEIQKMPSEYYNSVLVALDSICSGSFKSMKRIGKSDDGFYSPLLQVRDNAIRIYYLKISANLYLISDVIVKKINVTKNYSHFVRRISKDAYKQKEKFLKMNDEQKNIYIENCKEITSQIKDELLIKKKVLK